MDKQIKLIKRIWKTGFISLVVATMLFGGLILNLKAALATGSPTPNMTVRHEGLIGANGNWSHNVTLNPGDEVQFYAEIHNTVVGSTADNVRLKVNLTGGTFTDGTSVATVSANNANSASDTVNIHINGGGKLDFIQNSTRITWDVNGDGNKEFNNTYVAGNPTTGDGLLIGDQHGCNQYIIQVYWAARVVGNPASPTPTPSPTPPASPTPTPGPTIINNNSNENNNTNTQNQTVNVTGAVAGVSIPAKQPDTGVSVLGLASMFGSAPVGVALSRFGKGKKVVGKREEESLAEIAFGLVNRRSGKNSNA